MIECTNSNIYYKKRRKFTRFFSVLLSIILIVGISFYYKVFVTENIINICSSYAYTFSNKAVNNAVINSLKDELNYSDIITVEKNQSGDIVFLSVNSYKTNNISREVSVKTQEYLENELKKGIPIPWLAFFGIPLISGYGREISFKTCSVSSVVCGFTSSFSSVGINQTLHSIYVLVNCTVDIKLPFFSKQKTCETSVLLSESVLIGNVPEVYLNGNMFK